MEIKEKLESTKEELHEKEGKMKDYASSAETCKSEIENMLVRNHFEKAVLFSVLCKPLVQVYYYKSFH